MTINTGQYCLVDTSGPDQVLQGPQRLPQNWTGEGGETYTNINNSDIWNDDMLRGIGWYPYRLIDTGPPEPEPRLYNRSLGPFVITATEVTQTAIYVEFTQAEYDQSASTTITDSQRVATDLARQTEAHIITDDSRLLTGRTPLIPTADRPDVEAYLGSCYDAMDNPAVSPQEPPGATRQITDVPGEEISRGVVRRALVDWAGQDYTQLTYVLYPGAVDPTGMSFKVHLTNGTYLSTYNLVDQGDGSWLAETNIIGQYLGDVALDYTLYKGVDISQKRRKEAGDFEDDVFDVRWLEGNLAQRITDGSIVIPELEIRIP